MESKPAPRRLRVLGCNMDAVHVFLHVPLEIISGMAVHYQGIKPSEVQSAADMLGIPAAGVLEKCTYMASIQCKRLNANVKRNAKS